MKKKSRYIIPPIVAFFLCFYLINLNVKEESIPSSYINDSNKEETIELSEKKTEIPTSKVNKDFLVPENEDEKKNEKEVVQKEINTFKIENLNCILQEPELPTGCEVTSLAIVLNYLGISVDKLELSDNYLIKGEIGAVTPYEAFLGEPRNKYSYGCYYQVIIETANNYLKSINSNLKAESLTDSDFETLLNEVSLGNPIIIWITIGLNEPFYSTKWNINGEDFTWKANEHCVVLYGFDKENNIVYISDPLEGNMEYDLERIKYLYKEMYSQAVIIH